MGAEPAGLHIDEPEYFDRLAEVEERHWWSLGMWRLADLWLARALRGRIGLRALDVGCGAGLTLDRLAGRPEIAEAVGLDPSPDALAHSRVRRGRPLIQGSALALPFPDSSFDVVTCFDVFQHLPEGSDRVAAAELRRVLRAGGVAVVRSNARGWARPDHGGGTLYRLDDLVGAIAASGLRTRRSTLANCLPALVQELRGRIHMGSNPKVRSHPAGGGLRIRMPPPWLNRAMGAIATTEAIVAGRFGIGLPFGHSTMVLAERA